MAQPPQQGDMRYVSSRDFWSARREPPRSVSDNSDTDNESATSGDVGDAGNVGNGASGSPQGRPSAPNGGPAPVAGAPLGAGAAGPDPDDRTVPQTPTLASIGDHPEYRGHDVTPLPIRWQPAVSSWVRWQRGTFPVPIRPARIEVLNMPRDMRAAGGTKFCEVATGANRQHAERIAAFCRIASLFGVAAEKGFLNGSHIEADEEDALRQKDWKKHHEGTMKQYVYAIPTEADGSVPAGSTAQMFVYAVEEVSYNGTVVADRMWKLIFDKTHSSDLGWAKTMEESAETASAGHANTSALGRTDKKVRENKERRALAEEEHGLASCRYVELCNRQQLLEAYQIFGNATNPAQSQRTFFGEARVTLPHNVTMPPFRASKDNLGGDHALGPSVALCARRRGEDFDVMTAGLVDKHGNAIRIDQEQATIDAYLEESSDGKGFYFRPHPAVMESGAFCLKPVPTQLNIFTDPLPAHMQTHSNPDEILLRIYWEMHVQHTRQPDETGFEDNVSMCQQLFDKFLNPAGKGVVAAAQDLDSNPMLSVDTMNKTLGEEAMLSGSNQTAGEDAEVPQILNDLSAEVEIVCGLVARWHAKFLQHFDDTKHASDAEAEALYAKHQEEYAEARDAASKLGLNKFENAFASHRLRKTIPPGWLAIYDGMRESIRTCGELSRRKVDPSDPRRDVGTISSSFAHMRTITSRDVTVFGHWQQFKMHMLSKVAKISGDDTLTTTEIYNHFFEAVLPRSFLLIIAGEGGAGKTVRMARVAQMLAPRWAKKGGQSSEKAGTAGGIDPTCGHVLIHDELPNELQKSSGPRIDWMKQVCTEQQVSHDRMVQVKGKHGDAWKSPCFLTVHYATRMFAFNGGVQGTGKEQDLVSARNAIWNRSIGYVVKKHVNSELCSDAEFKKHLSSIHIAPVLNQFRLVSELTAFLLLYIKNIPSLQPDLRLAKRVLSELDDYGHKYFDIPRLDLRVREKREIELMHFAIEAAVANAIFVEEATVDYPDLCPMEDGSLRPFEIEQLVPILRDAQIRLDFEVINTVWSHALAYQSATADWMQTVKMVLCKLHGFKLDFLSLDDTDVDTPTSGDTQRSHALPRPSPCSLMYGEGISRADCADCSEALALQRAVESVYRSHATTTENSVWMNSKPTVDALTGLFSDSELQKRLPLNLEPISPEQMAGAMMQTPQDVVNSGYDKHMLATVLSGKSVDVATRANANAAAVAARHSKKGTSNVTWAYAVNNPDDANHPGKEDFNWRVALVEHGISELGNDSKYTSWYAAARAIANTQHWKRTRMDVEVLKDCLALLATANMGCESTIGETTAEDHIVGERMQFASDTHTKWNLDSEPTAVFPQHVREKQIDTNGNPVLVKEFDKPVSIQRPRTQLRVLGDSVRMRRMDYLNTHRALPAARIPTKFTNGTPIRAIADKSGTGFKLNSAWAQHFCHFLLEACTYLTALPGVMGAPPADDLFDEFKNEAARLANQADSSADVEMADAPAAGAANGGVSDMELEDAAHRVNNLGNHHTTQRLQAPDHASSDGVPTGNGMSAAAVAKAFAPNAKVGYLFYSYSACSMFLSCKMIDLFSLEAKEYAQWMLDNQHPVFRGESIETMLRDMPQFSTRFPAPAVQKNGCTPLLKQVADQQKFTADATRSIVFDSKRQVLSDMATMEAEVAMVTGRSVVSDADVDPSDPENFDVNDRRGLDMEGNLMSRAFWVNWTLKTLSDHGHPQTKQQYDMVEDQLLFLRLRIRQHESIHKADTTMRVTDEPVVPFLSTVTMAPCRSQFAMERDARTRADRRAGSSTTTGAKRPSNAQLAEQRRQSRHARPRND